LIKVKRLMLLFLLSISPLLLMCLNKEEISTIKNLVFLLINLELQSSISRVVKEFRQSVEQTNLHWLNGEELQVKMERTLMLFQNP